MSKYDDIRFYNDEEVNPALKEAVKNPMIRTLFQYTFPDLTFEEISERVTANHSIEGFQKNIVYETAQRVLQTTSEGVTTSGFEMLDPDESYLYISNHRDILLDTVILNVMLYDKGLIPTASAIGDNLVQKPFLEKLAKLNRNFFVKRGLSPREMLKSSIKLSNYINHLLQDKNQSVWLAQREGRTKDGNDQTQQGVLKMLDLARPKGQSIANHFNGLKIVPVSISYEYDPTDKLKVPELLAKNANEPYIKKANEDFYTILEGVLGQKKHIHLAASSPLTLSDELPDKPNLALRKIAEQIDEKILSTYKLWPSNYVAADMLSGTETHRHNYTGHDRAQFDKRMGLRVDRQDKSAVKSFIEMYANPVFNKQKFLYEA